MSEINIHYPLDCHIDHSKKTMKTLLQLLEEKYAIKSKFSSDTVCSLSGSGVSGQLLIHEDNIEIFAKLGFFMAPFKAIIENEIRNKLDECFSG